MNISIQSMPKTFFKSDDYGLSIDEINNLTKAERNDVIAAQRKKRVTLSLANDFIGAFNSSIYPRAFIKMAADLKESTLKSMFSFFVLAAVPLSTHAKYADPRNEASMQYFTHLSSLDLSDAIASPDPLLLNLDSDFNVDHHHFEKMMEEIINLDAYAAAQIWASAFIGTHKTIQQEAASSFYALAMVLKKAHLDQSRLIQDPELLSLISAATSTHVNFPFI